MQKIALLCLLPALIALAIVWSVREQIDRSFPQGHYFKGGSYPRYIERFDGDALLERSFFGADASSKQIYLLGSSELTGGTPAHPYNFIPEHFGGRFLAVGHAGNQCFSMYSQLLANQENLKGKRIVVILSPGWFQSHFAEGTSSSLFLQYNSQAFLNRIRTTCPKNEFRAWETKRIAEFYDEITGPHLDLKLLAFEHQSSKSPLHKAIYAPIVSSDKGLERLRPKKQVIFEVLDTFADDVPAFATFSWDTLLKNSRARQLEASNNNSWTIENAIYTVDFSDGDHGKIFAVPRKYNRELEDFHMLVRLLKSKGADASFVILPLNPYYYTNLAELDPVIQELSKTLDEYYYPCLNFWATKPENFEKGVLVDVMHLSNYGWYMVDHFIASNYSLKIPQREHP